MAEHGFSIDGVIPSMNGLPSNESVPKEFLADVHNQMDALMDGVSKLVSKMEAKANRLETQQPASVEEFESFVKAQNDMAARVASTVSDLTALPKTFDETTVIVTEFDDICMNGEVDKALLGEARAAEAASGASARTDALQALRMSLEDASAHLAAAKVTLRDDFIEFAEVCGSKCVRLIILTESLKPLVRLLLREQGLGHIEVLAHDMMVSPSTTEWKVSLNQDGWKAEAFRRALQNSKTKPTAVLQVGRLASDLPVATAGKVTGLLAPVSSALNRLAVQSGLRHREFAGWEALAGLVMGVGSANAMPMADGTDLADLD